MARRHHYDTLPVEDIRRTLCAWREHDGNASAAARELKIAPTTLYRHLALAVKRGLLPADELPGGSMSEITRALAGGRNPGMAEVMDMVRKPMERPTLPDDLPPVDELIERRKREYQRHDQAQKARQLIPVKVKIAGPIAIAHFGDPHVDDPGTDIATLERHVSVVNKTEGMFGANVGDLSNNWIGRLAKLYGEQSTSAKEAWRLVEWLVRSCDWLYLLAGNHDLWSGAGDPVHWIASQQGIAYEEWGARLGLAFPNGRQVRVNARHDFTGHSMWNTAHGPAKAAQMGWRDHILTCGHKHTSGYQMLKDPASGLVSHALRVAGYKIHDRYARTTGLPNQNITPASVTIIDPRYADDDVRLVTVIHDVEMAADFLIFLRRRRK